MNIITNAHNIPIVIENGEGGEKSFDVYSRLLRERVIFLSGDIETEMANLVVAQMLVLEADSSEKDIQLYINSGGGYVTAGMAIYDTMQFVGPDVSTICMGQASSMAAVLLSGGAPGKRYALPNSYIMIHQPLGGTQGQASDIAIQAREMEETRRRLNNILSYHTGQPIEKIREDTERDFSMYGEDAVKYGLIDKVLKSRLTL